MHSKAHHPNIREAPQWHRELAKTDLQGCLALQYGYCFRHDLYFITYIQTHRRYLHARLLERSSSGSSANHKGLFYR